MKEKGSLEAAWLASVLLESLKPARRGGGRSTTGVLDMVDRLAAKSHAFDAGARERVELLSSIADSLRSGARLPAHLVLLEHMARGLLIQSVNAA